MARKGKVVARAIKLGTKYGPQIWVASKALREPAKEAAAKVMASERARKAAFEHARTRADGSILKVYKGDQSLWVVFSGDTAITVHPPTDVPLPTLLTLPLLSDDDEGRRSACGTAMAAEAAGSCASSGS